MNELYREYYQTIKDQKVKQMFNAIDLHGARIHVVRSTCASYVGVQGIVVQELPDTIVVVQENGKTV